MMLENQPIPEDESIEKTKEFRPTEEEVFDPDSLSGDSYGHPVSTDESAHGTQLQRDHSSPLKGDIGGIGND